MPSTGYTALGSTDHPKELLDIYSDGKVAQLIDYKEFRVAGAKHKPISLGTPDKGHRRQLKAFARAVREGGDWPIPLWQQVQATAIALDVQAQLEV